MALSAAAAAKSLQLCPTLCNPRDVSPPGSPVPGILQARTLEWVATSFSNAWKWKVKGKSLSRVWLFAIPWTAAYQASPSMGFSSQEYWSGVPLPFPWLSLGSSESLESSLLGKPATMLWRCSSKAMQKELRPPVCELVYLRVAPSVPLKPPVFATSNPPSVKSESCSVVFDSLQPHGLYSPCNSPGQNTGVGSLFLLQGIFPTQGSNLGLPHCGQILYQLSHKGSPRILEWVVYPFSSGSSWPRKWTGVSCIAGGFFTNWAIRETLKPSAKYPAKPLLNSLPTGTEVIYTVKPLSPGGSVMQQ